ncbi:hypothetical protein [Leptospira terpstrae]|uniref:Uncharacterized protein n=1 Tax=Leptospira terpstrae serovar Hualin str. LT 11-33 = ATCC 700639 TaxID=1257025 RepID=N1VQE9_9LEPT|nr:hypothetical protein [Leptospira terpstrae]EMY60673.1 hypothetical protein LEP1GSC203_0333 [Leptospira terpstrae serovar Hualin str. LT 11-33 = ATCC 700639]
MSGSNGGFNTFLDIYNTANTASTKRNTEALLNASLEQNQQIMHLRRQMELAQEQANQIALQQLELKLREEVAKQEQKFLRKFIFATETIIENVSDLESGVERYSFLNFDVIPIVHYIEKAIEDLDNLDDKRAARQQLKMLKEKQEEVKKFEKEYLKSGLNKLRISSQESVELVKLEAPKKTFVALKEPVKYKSKYSFPFFIAIFFFIIWLSDFSYRITDTTRNAFEGTYYLEYLYFYHIPSVLIPGYFAYQRIKKYKTKAQIEIINKSLIAEHEAELRKEEEKYQILLDEYNQKHKANEEKIRKKAEIVELAKSEYPEYFEFREEVLKQLSPEKFKLNS